MQVRVSKVQQKASTLSLPLSVSSLLSVAFATVALVMIVTARFAERLRGLETGVDVISGRRYNIARGLTLEPKSVLILELD